MKKLLNSLLIVLITSSFLTVQVQAQETAHITETLRPISSELRDALNAWLATDAPSEATEYIVTYSKQKGSVTVVSLVGVYIPFGASDWSLENEGTTTWLGTVEVDNNGVVTRRDVAGTAKMASLKISAGGGSYVAFPFQAGTAMLYGPHGVHGEGGYTTSGMYAVDLVSGDDLGSGAAPPYAYASDDGVIDYVCDDGTTVAVRTYNSETGDYFLYAHMLDNENLDIDSEFTRGELIGNLKYGSFDPEGSNCGWADQQEDHYHLHWMFVPSGGAFQAEGCVLSMSSQRWDCNGQQISIGGWLYGGGGSGVGNGSGTGVGDVNGAAGAYQDVGFWDYIIAGVVFIADPFYKLMPEHTGYSFIYVFINAVRLLLVLIRVYIYGNVNIGPFVAAMTAFFGFQIAVFPLKLYMLGLQMYKRANMFLGT